MISKIRLTHKYLRVGVDDAGHTVVVDMSRSSEHGFGSNDTLRIRENSKIAWPVTLKQKLLKVDLFKTFYSAIFSFRYLLVLFHKKLGFGMLLYLVLCLVS